MMRPGMFHCQALLFLTPRSTGMTVHLENLEAEWMRMRQHLDAKQQNDEDGRSTVVAEELGKAPVAHAVGNALRLSGKFLCNISLYEYIGAKHC